MEAVVPWKALIDLIEPHHPKAGSKGGRPAYPLEMQGKAIGFRLAMRSGKRRAPPDTSEGQLDDLIETALAAGFCLQ
jgi:hypothetical protein